MKKTIDLTLPLTLIKFIERYRTAHHLRNSEQVVLAAIECLQQHELELEYLAANAEIDADFDCTVVDGLKGR